MQENLKTIKLAVNGIKREAKVSPDAVLIDYLRNELQLTGTKQSCDRKGQCGACTVIINGKTTRSCTKKMADLDGADVVSIEGLGTPGNPHLIQEAFALAGAIQCGYCTPGMIMAAKGLLDSNTNPGIADIRKAMPRNLCRCTGYKKIIEAIQLAGKFIRGETNPAEVRRNLPKGMIGVSHPRPSALLKACGLAKFSVDIAFPNMVELAVVHSTESHAKIKSIDTSAAEKMPGVIGFMRADDIKGTNHIRVMVPDQPVLCEDEVRLLGDPIIAVAAETRDQARKAAAAVKVAYEPLKVMMTPEEALASDAIQIHPTTPFVPPSSPANLCSVNSLIKGEGEKGLAKSKTLVEAVFNTQINHQAALEPEASVAILQGEGEKAQLVVYGRSCYIHETAAHVSEAVGRKNVRYIEPYVGGNFGTKANITSEAITAAATLHFKRPVRYVPSQWESMMISSKRHPFSMKVKLGADAGGHLTAYTNNFVVNKGAYFALGFVPINRALMMFSGSYHIPDIYALGKLVYTNNAWGGVARGAGPPQVTFALESAMDMLAEKVGMDPLEFRKINSLKPGQAKATGYIVKQWPFPELCDDIKPYFEKAKKSVAEFNKKGGLIKRGVGIAVHSFGVGETGDVATVQVEVNPDDSITIYAAIADPGEGNDSMLTQIASHLLKIPMNKIKLYTRDTEKTTMMGPSAASRMTYMGGGALIDAINNLKAAIKEAGVANYAGLLKAGKPVKYEGKKVIEGSGNLDPKTGQGASFESDVHNIQMAEVEVNTETGEVRVIKMTTVIDAGTILHPRNLEGQLEGGMDQGVGYALREEYVHGKTKDWVTFKFPTFGTSFETEIITRETPRINGPLGATGIGEMTMVSTAPAVTNAIYNACGVRIFDLPATPDKIKAGLAARKK